MHIYLDSIIITIIVLTLLIRFYLKLYQKTITQNFKIFFAAVCIIIFFYIIVILWKIIELLGYYPRIEYDKQITIYSGRAEWECNAGTTDVGIWAFILAVTWSRLFYLFLTDYTTNRHIEIIETLWITISATVILWPVQVLWEWVIYPMLKDWYFILHIVGIILTLLQFILAKFLYKAYCSYIIKYKENTLNNS